MSAPTVYHYPKCSTCRKALTYLKSNGIEHRLVDIVESPPSVRTLKRALQRCGLPITKLFNTSGVSYREGGFKNRLGDMTQDEALAALAADGKLIKRPLLVSDEIALVGFRPEEWQRALES